MSAEAFEALSKAEQFVYVSYLFRGADRYVSDWRSSSRSQPTDIYRSDSGLDDTPQQIVAACFWTMRMAMSLVDPEDRQKAFIASFWGGRESQTYDRLASLEKGLGGIKAKGIASSGQMVIPVATTEQTNLRKDPNGGTWTEIDVVDPDGGATHGVLYFIETTGYDGSPFTTWIQR